jgi:hypothetical protein
LLQIGTAKKHNLIWNRGRIRAVTAHLPEQVKTARRVSGLRQRANEWVQVHAVVNLVRIAPVPRVLEGRTQDGRKAAQGRVCGFSLSE